MRFFVVNRTGVPVHIRLDETDATGTFKLTISSSKISGGRPLTRHVLATAMPLHITFLDGEAKYIMNNRIGMLYSWVVDGAGDYVVTLNGFIQ